MIMALEDPAVDDVPVGSKASPSWAWGICWLMFASTVLNYMDRQTITLVSQPIKMEFRLDNADFGWVMARLVESAIDSTSASIMMRCSRKDRCLWMCSKNTCTAGWRNKRR